MAERTGCEKFQRAVGSSYELCIGCDAGNFSIETGDKGSEKHIIHECKYASNLIYEKGPDEDGTRLDIVDGDSRKLSVVYLHVGNGYEFYRVIEKQGPYISMPIAVALNMFGLKQSMTEDEMKSVQKKYQ